MLIHGNSYFIYFYSWSCTLKNKFLSSIFSVAINQTLLNINLKVWEFTCQCKRHKKLRFNPWVRKIPWRRAWQPIPVFLPGKSHGHRSLVSCAPEGHKESNTTEVIYYTAAVAAKSLQSCPTLCDPIDSSPPGSAILGILQARTLECIAISFSTA